MKYAMGLIAAAVVSCGPVARSEDGGSKLASGGVPTGQLRGYEAVSEALKQRLLAPEHEATDRFELGVLLGTRDPASLPTLLGGFSGSGADAAYRNGVPNAMNSALWYLTAQRLAVAVAKVCDEPQGPFLDEYALAAEVRVAVEQLCAWPETDAAAVGIFWDLVMGPAAPASERALWLEFMEGLRAGGARGHEVVATAVETIVLDPYFLLEP